MLKKSVLLIHFGFLCSVSFLYSQCPGANLVFNTQEEIDQFIVDYPDCTEILGALIIEETEIENLQGLRNLKKIGGDFRLKFNHQLTSLDGLDNLYYIGQSLRYQNNQNIEHIDGLSGLRYIGRNLALVGYDKITNIDAFKGLDYIPGTLSISYHDSLLHIDGLSNVDSIGTQLTISNNLVLNNIEGLASLKKILPGGISQISGESILSLRGLDSLSLTGALWIEFLPRIKNLNGLENWEYAEGYTSRIQACDSLISLKGLDKLKVIKGDFYINENNQLASLDGLEQLEIVENELNVGRMGALEDLDGLQGLTIVGGELKVWRAPVLRNLYGLRNVDHTEIDLLTILENESLDYCSVESICNYLDAGGPHEIYNNLTNCSSGEEIQGKCTSSIDEASNDRDSGIWSNLVTSQVSIYGFENFPLLVEVYDPSGRAVLKVQSMSETIDLDNLSPGLYYITVRSESQTLVDRIIKM